MIGVSARIAPATVSRGTNWRLGVCHGRRVAVLTAAIASLVVAGCATPPPAAPTDTESLRATALRYVTEAAGYQANPVIRAQAIEALQEAQGERSAAWFRNAIDDEHPGVRFAACMALGAIRHAPSEGAIRKLLQDPDESVRIAAMYALRRLGDPHFIKPWADVILSHRNPAVRRNAVLALGRLGEPDAIALLRRAREDEDDGVRLQALEAMAMLGDKGAIARLLFYANSTFGDQQAFALVALGRAGDPRVIDTLRYCLAKAPHIESRLAAARGLGYLGRSDGLDVALASIEWDHPNPKIADDEPVNQVMRVRTLAAFALGAIGDRRALGALERRMKDPTDARTQLAAASAILQILSDTTVPTFTPSGAARVAERPHAGSPASTNRP